MMSGEGGRSSRIYFGILRKGEGDNSLFDRKHKQDAWSRRGVMEAELPVGIPQQSYGTRGNETLALDWL